MSHSDPGTGERIGAYRIRGELGRGGMGVVYRAVDERLDRPVALKVIQAAKFLHGDDLEQVRARFRREAQLAARVSHPGLVTIYSFETVDDLDLIAMELVEGQPLSTPIAAGYRWEPEEARKLVVKMARAVGAAHAKGVTHRDLKPANILLTSEGRPKIVDFGVARPSDPSATKMTATGWVLGTVQYMSPEQLLSKEVGPASDVFSLAVVAYEMITGEPAFGEGSPMSVGMRIAKEEPPLIGPEGGDPSIFAHLLPVLQKALEKDPEKRLSDGSALAAALEAVDPAPSLWSADLPTIPHPGLGTEPTPGTGPISDSPAFEAGAVRAAQPGPVPWPVAAVVAAVLLVGGSAGYLVWNRAPPAEADAAGTEVAQSLPGREEMEGTGQEAAPGEGAEEAGEDAAAPDGPPEVAGGISPEPAGPAVARAEDPDTPPGAGVSAERTTAEAPPQAAAEDRTPEGSTDDRATLDEPTDADLPPAQEEQAPGTLQLTAIPFAGVELRPRGEEGAEWTRIGDTPMESQVEPGTYELRFTGPGGRMILRDTSVSSEAVARVGVDFTTATPPPAEVRGRIQVSVVRGWAFAALDGGSTHETPVSLEDVAPGLRVLRIWRPGFQEIVDSVRVGPGETIQRQYELVPHPGSGGPGANAVWR